MCTFCGRTLSQTDIKDLKRELELTGGDGPLADPTDAANDSPITDEGTSADSERDDDGGSNADVTSLQDLVDSIDLGGGSTTDFASTLTDMPPVIFSTGTPQTDPTTSALNVGAAAADLSADDFVFEISGTPEESAEAVESSLLDGDDPYERAEDPLESETDTAPFVDPDEYTGPSADDFIF